MPIRGCFWDNFSNYRKETKSLSCINVYLASHTLIKIKFALIIKGAGRCQRLHLVGQLYGLTFLVRLSCHKVTNNFQKSNKDR